MRKTYTLHNGKGGAALAILVYPNAQQNEITEIGKDGGIKIMLRSSADAAEVNTKLVMFLANVLSVSKADIEIVAGVKSNKKLVSVFNISAQAAHERIVNHLN